MSRLAKFVPNQDAVKFVVIGNARSGTSLTADLLRGHPDVSCLLEPITAIYEERVEQHRYYWDDDCVWINPCKGADHRGTYKDMLQYINERIWTLPGMAIGTKLPTAWLRSYERLFNHLRQIDGLRVICTSRNPIRSTMSGWYAQQLRSWNTTDPKKVKRREPGIIPWTWFRKIMEHYDANTHTMLKFSANRPFFRVHYSDLVKKLKRSMDEVCEFLGIPAQEEYVATFQKMTPQPFKELVTNWEALRDQSPPKWQIYWDDEEML